MHCEVFTVALTDVHVYIVYTYTCKFLSVTNHSCSTYPIVLDSFYCMPIVLTSSMHIIGVY